MLRHRFILPLFIVLFAILIFLDNSYPILWYHYGFFLLLFLSLEIYGASYIGSGFHIKTITCGSQNERSIALTFDDGPGPMTSTVLDILKEENVPATFFVIGHKISGHENILRRMVEEGHLVGNHSFEHNYWYDLKRKKEFIEDLSKTDNLLSSALGKRPLFFRPPYGVTTPALASAIQTTKHTVIGWNIRSLDTKIKHKKQLLTRIQKKICPGAILLLHDTVSGTDLVVKDLITYLKKNNYKIVPLNKLINNEAYA